MSVEGPETAQVGYASPDLLDVEPDEPVRLPKKNNKDDEMDITPMIDITFLLLIFFLVASKINADAPVDIPTAKHGLAVPAKACVTVIVRRGNGENSKVENGDGVPFSSDLGEQEVEIAEYVQQGLDQGKTQVMIKAEADCTSGEIKRVNKAVSEALTEGMEVNLAILDGK
jgi:biopolymer transport protein ExbD